MEFFENKISWIYLATNFSSPMITLGDKTNFCHLIPKKIGANTEIFWSLICEIFGDKKWDLLVTIYIIAH